ncbi:Cu2+-exporting ATPase [Sulfobacillus thermosulfidooxidans DSM 9293]|uniref:Probable copper-transporting ATPase SynA n=1 Tax=Sulfobacillus thermosulfidooxidans (strain DSM 9293 / VKM B-1269 / AT-1) TaxID=929705 RepID=A0A1W1W785_SULTA|nr:cation-translocating P-type ATPase [Sulfobacillus thermosulfidooxidans]SMC02157.1 Cu2+-exporting ATPase [Sulfobacillus thermosulfidooxidans DSM 9293]
MAVLTCYLCEQPVVTEVPGDGHIFCCHGCRELWRLMGDEEIKELKSRPGVNWENLRESITTPTPVLPLNADPKTVTIDIDGMWCASCSILVEQVLTRMPGVLGAQIDFATSTAQVAMDASTTSSHELEQAIIKLGYDAKERETSDEELEFDRDLVLLRRFGISVVLTIFVMMFSVPVWSGYLPQFPPTLRESLEYGLWALATPTVFFSGWPFLRGAWSSLRHGVPTMDLLISIGSLSAYGYSIYTIFSGGKYLYFDTATMFITFLLLSRNLEVGTRNRAAGVVRMLSRLSVKSAWVLRDGQEIQTDISQVHVDDQIVVRPGEKVPVDGTVIEGHSAINEAFLTGEAVPVDKKVGDIVYAGTVNSTGRLVIKALRVADDTILAQTSRFVKAAQGAQGQWRKLADRVLRIFVPSVLVFGLLTFVYWDLVAKAGTAPALLNMIAVFVIACPCALSVATPLAVLAGAQRLGGYGMLLRSDDALERASDVDTVIMDKTGTLTTGQMTLTEFWPMNPEIMQLVGSLELASEHPIAAAVIKYMEQQHITYLPIEQFTEEPGWGIKGQVAGHDVHIGQLDGTEDLSSEMKEKLNEWQEEGRTIAKVVVDEAIQALFSVEDQPRAHAKEAVSSLAHQGIQVIMATGDSEEAARVMAQKLGITRYYARQKPIDKATLVEELESQGHHVAFVGDGINDAPALVKAHLGIAMGTGSDIAIEAGHLTLTRPNLMSLVDTLTTSKQVTRIIKQNLLWALFYNALALPAAALGYTGPFIAAVAMLLSSAFVLANSLRILGFSPKRYILGTSVALGVGTSLALIAWLGL